MTSRLRPSSLLLALALLLGQWLVLAHDFEHPALADDANCQICVHAQGLDGGAPASAPALALAITVAGAPLALVPAAPALPAAASYDIRGPPSAA